MTVDCQYGGGNVTFFKAENVAVIDHHRVSGELPAMNRVMSYMGSCATIVWDMLREEGVEIIETWQQHCIMDFTPTPENLPR